MTVRQARLGLHGASRSDHPDVGPLVRDPVPALEPTCAHRAVAVEGRNGDRLGRHDPPERTRRGRRQRGLARRSADRHRPGCGCGRAARPGADRRHLCRRLERRTTDGPGRHGEPTRSGAGVHRRCVHRNRERRDVARERRLCLRGLACREGRKRDARHRCVALRARSELGEADQGRRHVRRNDAERGHDSGRPSHGSNAADDPEGGPEPIGESGGDAPDRGNRLGRRAQAARQAGGGGSAVRDARADDPARSRLSGLLAGARSERRVRVRFRSEGAAPTAADAMRTDRHGDVVHRRRHVVDLARPCASGPPSRTSRDYPGASQTTSSATGVTTYFLVPRDGRPWRYLHGAGSRSECHADHGRGGRGHLRLRHHRLARTRLRSTASGRLAGGQAATSACVETPVRTSAARAPARRAMAISSARSSPTTSVRPALTPSTGTSRATRPATASRA